MDDAAQLGSVLLEELSSIAVMKMIAGWSMSPQPWQRLNAGHLWKLDIENQALHLAFGVSVEKRFCGGTTSTAIPTMEAAASGGHID